MNFHHLRRRLLAQTLITGLRLYSHMLRWRPKARPVVQAADTPSEELDPTAAGTIEHPYAYYRW